MSSIAEHRIETSIPRLDALLETWRPVIGEDWQGYRNHVCRMLNFCMHLHESSDEDVHKMVIAGVFHDLGLWTEQTLDYLDPSEKLARAYLAENGLQDWQEEIGLMITEHHKLRSAHDARYPLVEVFRRGDLVDFSLGLFRFGLSRPLVRAVQAEIPNAGFHPGLLRKASRWFLRHPLNPAPMMKW